MKIVKSMIILLTVASFNFTQGQAIVQKWDDLNSFSSILTKVNYIAKEGNFEIFSQYSSMMTEFSKKLIPANMPSELRNAKVDEALTKLGSDITNFDALAQRKGDKKEMQEALYNLNLSYTNFVKMVKVD